MFRAIILPIFRSTRLCVTTSGIMYTQTSVPEDGRNHRAKHVELIGIINKSLLLNLVGCLYYLHQRCTVKQLSDNEIYLLIKYIIPQAVTHSLVLLNMGKIIARNMLS